MTQGKMKRKINEMQNFCQCITCPLSNSQAAQSNSEPALLRATLEDGPRSRVQWNKEILLDESHKLDPWPLKEGPQPKIGKLRLNLHGTILEGKSIGLDPPKKKDFQGELMIWRTKMQASC